MTLREAREGAKRARREAILREATALFAEQGFNDADTQVLAERIGIGKGTLYRHFPSKRDLFLAATDRAIAGLHDRMETAASLVVDPLAKIAAAVRAYLAYFAAHPQYVELLIQERALFRDRKRPSYFEHRDRNADEWRTLYTELIASGRVRPIAIDSIRDVMNQVLYGTIFANYFDGCATGPEVQSRDILDVVFRGILADSERLALPPESSDIALEPARARAS